MLDQLEYGVTVDPLEFAKVFWPKVKFYKQQQELMLSVRDNDETFCPAGNMLGKDFVSAYIVLWFFLTRRPCRIITTSAKDDHQRVLWGEMINFINTCRFPLKVEDGGPIRLTDKTMEWEWNGVRCPISYVKGMVASDATIAALQGHHVAQTGDGIARTLFLTDESSSVPHEYWKMGRTWANRMLAIGNTWPCENFFKHAITGRPGTNDTGGDLPRPVPRGLKPGARGYYRKVLRITAKDSPNVRYALAEIARGKQPSNRIVVPGVKPWSEYQKNLQTLDPAEIAVICDAEFYEGPATKLYPKEWLLLAKRLAVKYANENLKRVAKGAGIDPAEGGDNTALSIVDELGLMHLESSKTPDTDGIAGWLIGTCKSYGLPGERVCIDRGGGGKQIADRCRAMGYPIRTVGFGESIQDEPHRGKTTFDTRVEVHEDRYVYMNRRAQMYGELSEIKEFAIPAKYFQLFQQLVPIPKTWDREGRLYLLPKSKKSADDKQKTLTELIGHSPDEADSLVLAVHAMLHKKFRRKAGVVR